MIARASNIIGLLEFRSNAYNYSIGLSDLSAFKKDGPGALSNLFLDPLDTYPYGVTVYKAKRAKKGYQKYPVPSPAKDSLSGVLGRGSLF
jgi:hypothetical protein